MKIKLLVIMLTLTSLVACSNSRKRNVADANSDVNLEQGITSFDGDADFIVDADEDKFLLGDEFGGSEDKEVADISDSSFLEDAPSNISGTKIAQGSFDSGVASGGNGEYISEQGDTLMLISFKIYGDYARWREIARINNLSGKEDLNPGTVIKYTPPVQKFVWNPMGNPYLVKRGDTLGKISQAKYHTTSKWKDIWSNNKVMIKNPDLIFAGFTLYYVPQRDLASDTSYMD